MTALTWPAPRRPSLAVPAATAAALGLAAAGGVLVAQSPRMAAALVVAAAGLALALRAPVAHLLLTLTVTIIVPLSVQSRFGSGGSADAAGAIPSDLLLLGGLLRVALVLPGVPLDRRAARALGLVAAVVALTLVQLVHAVRLGRAVSGLGAEARVLMSLAVFAMALPLLQDPASRRRLLAGTLVLGAVLGAWGVLQAVGHLSFDSPPDAAATSSRSFMTAGRTVGMYAFPVAALGALAVLAAGGARTRLVRGVLAATALLNLVALMLTYERTFYGALAAGFVVLVVRLRPGQRARLVAAAGVAGLLAAGAVAVAAPSLLHATADRLASVTSYQSDPSVGYRVVESHLVAQQVRRHPVTGNALGAAIMIGRPGTTRPIAPRRYAENGYLWLAWKLGLGGLLAVVALLAHGIAGRRLPHAAGALAHGLRAGAQAGLMAVAVATFFFGSFANLSVTPLVGLLAALSVLSWESA